MASSALPPRRPLVGITACRRHPAGDMPQHLVNDKYVRALLHGAKVQPVLIPSVGEALDINDLLGSLDGLLVSGSPSNVFPDLYGGPPSAPGTLHDPERDATTLPLIRAALATVVPVFGICRGLQELNVALGGTLCQKVHEQPGRLDHRWHEGDGLEIQYGPAHPVVIHPGGMLAGLLGVREIMVNSLHWQGIEQLATGLQVEATAHDGLVEAVSVKNAPGFAIAVQWHPEWRFAENPNSMALLEAFGNATRVRAQGRLRNNLFNGTLEGNG